MTVSTSIHIHVTHLGFTPDDPHKRAVITGVPVSAPIPFSVVDVGVSPYKTVYQGNAEYVRGDLGHAHIAAFGNLSRTGLYQIIAGDATADDLLYLAEEPRDPQPDRPSFSIPFWIRDDVYVKPLMMAFQYFPRQRSGVDVPGYHAASHLDDGIRDDTGAYHDAVGGWYDGGSVRKGVWPMCLSAYAISQLVRRIEPDWPSGESKHGAAIAELEFILPFLLKMQDKKTGIVFMDVGSGEERDNIDNRWTDNVKSDDDRKIRTEYDPWTQGLFIAALAAMSRLMPKKTDAARALKAAIKCANSLDATVEPEVIAQSLMIIGLCELASADTDNAAGWRKTARRIGDELLKLQESRSTGTVTGFFLSDERRDDFHRHHGLSGTPIIALATLAENATGKSAAKWRRALDLYVNETLAPLAERNVFGLIPYGLYRGKPLGELRRDLGAGLSYRYFMSPYRDLLRHRPMRKLGMEHGLNGHLLSMAVGLAYAAHTLEKKDGDRCRRMAEDQVRWVFGFNPLDMSFMTGLGHNTPYPHSRFVGQIPGGIVNGAIGGPDDMPWVDDHALMDWRTCEYWEVHNAWFIWLVSMIQESRLSPDARGSLQSVGQAVPDA